MCKLELHLLLEVGERRLRKVGIQGSCKKAAWMSPSSGFSSGVVILLVLLGTLKIKYFN